MKPRPRASRPATSALLLALLLPIPATAAIPVPVSLPPVARGTESRLAFTPGLASSPVLVPHTSDGIWRQFDLLQVAYGLAWYEAAHDQLLSLGGSQRHDWALPLGALPLWSPLPDPAGFTYPPYFVTLDPATGTVYAILDAVGTPLSAVDPHTGAVTPLNPSNAGPDVFNGALFAFDGAAQRIIVVVRNLASYPPVNDVWSLDLVPTPTWVHWSPAGTAPDPLLLSAVIVDPVRHRLLFPAAGLSSLFVLTLDATPTWSSLPTPGYLGTSPANGFAYDAASDAIWTLDDSGLASSLSLATNEWTPHDVLTTSPAPRQSGAITIDTSRHRLLLCGGTTSTQSDVHNDVWALTLDGPNEWIELVHDGFRPPARGGAGDGYDATRNRLVVFGGDDSYGRPLNGTWVLNLGATPSWQEVATQGGPPPERFWHSTAWDEQHDRLVVFGGYDNVNAMADCWMLSFAGGTPTWTPIVPPSGPQPPARFLSQLVRDPLRDRFLLFAGSNKTTVLSDVWELTLSPVPKWRLLPPWPVGARGAEMAVFDPVRARILVFGGSNSVFMLNDLYAMDIWTNTWLALTPATLPSPRNLGLLRYDSLRDRLLLFGGYGVESTSPGLTSINYLGDTWALPLTGTFAWQQLAPAGFSPPGRDRANGVYDPFADRLVLTCGGISGYNDTWALDFADAPTATEIALVSSDVSADRVHLVWFGAEAGTPATIHRRSGGADWSALAHVVGDGEGYIRFEDRDVTAGATLEYRVGVTRDGVETFFGATLVHVPARSLALASHGAEGRAAFTIELPSGAPASLELFDLAGRKVWSRDVGALGTGTHEVSAGSSFAPALYFARLKQGSEVRSARLVLVR